jgi:hypothetical protein
MVGTFPGVRCLLPNVLTIDDSVSLILLVIALGSPLMLVPGTPLGLQKNDDTTSSPRFNNTYDNAILTWRSGTYS